MRTHFAPRAPGIAGRALSPAEIAGIFERARTVDRLARRIARDVARGVRLMLASSASAYPSRSNRSQG